MICEAGLLLAADTLPWASVLTTLGIIIPAVLATAAGAWATMVTVRNQRLQKQIEVQACKETEQIKAATAQGEQVVKLQAQSDGHDEKLIQLAWDQVKELRAAITTLADKCEREKDILREKLAEAWKVSAVDREKLIRLEARLEVTEKRGDESSPDHHPI